MSTKRIAKMAAGFLLCLCGGAGLFLIPLVAISDIGRALNMSFLAVFGFFALIASIHLVRESPLLLRALPLLVTALVAVAGIFLAILSLRQPPVSSGNQQFWTDLFLFWLAYAAGGAFLFCRAFFLLRLRPHRQYGLGPD